MTNEETIRSLGKVLPEDYAGRRDAAHVAVIAVTAPVSILPGTKVDKDGWATDHDKLVGVVDPFLGGRVKKGETFWIYMFPGTVGGLRHSWSHPAWADSPDGPQDASGSYDRAKVDRSSWSAEDSDQAKIAALNVASSVGWLTEHAGNNDWSYTAMMEKVRDYVKTGVATESYDGDELDVDDKFWGHYKIVEGLIELPPHAQGYQDIVGCCI
jgi:hypothetical protein